MIDHMIDHPRCALWARMGMGKTSAVLSLVEGLHLAGDYGKVLVIGPLRVARDVWPEEAAKWENFKHLKVQPIIGSSSEREKALLNDHADIYTVNYEVLPWLVKKFMVEAWPFPIVIADEAVKLKSFRITQGSVRASAIARIAQHKVRRWINLTGAPAPNGLKDLWGQTWFLDRGFRLGKSYGAFESRWFAYQRVQDALNPGKTFVQPIIFQHSHAEIHDLVKDICLTIDPKDWFDLKEPITTTVKVTLPKTARKHYKELEREMFTQIEGHDVEAFSAAAKSMKCLQACSGFLYVGEGSTEWKVIHNEKIDALRSIITEANYAPVIVAYHFKASLARLKAAFPEGVDLATPLGMAAFKAGQSAVGFGHPASMGHGVDGLQNICNIAVFYESGWDMDQRMQFIERIGPTRQMQAGLDRPVFVYSIAASGTIDETVLARMITKVSVQEALLEAAKRRT